MGPTNRVLDGGANSQGSGNFWVVRPAPLKNNCRRLCSGVRKNGLTDQDAVLGPSRVGPRKYVLVVKQGSSLDESIRNGDAAFCQNSLTTC